MKSRRILASLFSGVLLFSFAAAPVQAGRLRAEQPTTPLGSAFTYQGYLNQGGQPANGNYDFQFNLYEASAGGIPLGVLNKDSVTVVNGYFTLLLDFGPGVFDAEGTELSERWLEIWVRPVGEAGYTVLTPRQLLTATPYANRAHYASASPWGGLVNIPAGFADGIDNDTHYAAGTGLVLSDTTFTADPGVLQLRIAQACTAGYAMRQIQPDGSVICEPVVGGEGDITAVMASDGLEGGGTSGEVTLGLAGTYRLPQTCAQDEIPEWEGASGLWVCSADKNTIYSAGTGLVLNGTIFSADTTYLQQRVSGACGEGYAIRTINVDGTVVCEQDTDTTYSASSGLVLTGTVFSADADYLQRRVSDACGAGYAMHSVNADGTVVCVALDNGSITGVVAGPGLLGGGTSGAITLTLDTAYTDNLYWQLGGNSTLSPGDNILGNLAPFSLTIVVSSTPALRLFPTAGAPNLIAGAPQNWITPGVKGTAIGGGGGIGGANRAADDYSTVGGCLDNQAGTNDGDLSNQQYATVAGGYWNTAGDMADAIGGGYHNQASGWYATIGGGWDNIAQGGYATVGGGGRNQAISTSGATVCGGYENGAFSWGATVGGGTYNSANGIYNTVGGGEQNAASDMWSFIGGGYNNRAASGHTVVGGGNSNQANGGSSFIGGGEGNITTTGGYAAISGGQSNRVDGSLSTIGGGSLNHIVGNYATIPGGNNNRASGELSFAAGHQADAQHNGAFVWSDASRGPTTSQRPDQFLVGASGGVTFLLNNGAWVDFIDNGTDLITTSVGAHLTMGGAWSNASDRNLKENFAAANNQQVLKKLAAMPIQTWSYKAEGAEVRHIGPTAQDFYTAFGYGSNQGSIVTVDADGVALASIQGLYQVTQEQEAQIASLEARLAALEEGQSEARRNEVPPPLLAVLLGLASGTIGAWVGRRKLL